MKAQHSTYSKIDNIIGHKRDLNKYKKIKVVSCLLSDHYGLRVVFNRNKNNRKSTYTWKLNNTLSTQSYVGQGRNKERNQRLFRI